MSAPSILVDGLTGIGIDPLDRGFHYGDGLFETVKVTAGRPLFWARHLARLAAGCGRLGIPLPDPGLLRADVACVCADGADGVLKIMVTRGSAGRGYRPPESCAPRRVVMFSGSASWPASHAQEGVAVRYCGTRLGLNPSLAGMKHLNRLEQVLARAELDPVTHPEGLMLDPLGNVIEGTMSNLFAVFGRRLVTPSVDACGVAGITRARVIDAAGRLGLDCAQAPLRPERLAEAEELFLTNSLIGIWPICRLEAISLRPGAVTVELQAALAEEEAREHG